jgi:four helix bundle protein
MTYNQFEDLPVWQEAAVLYEQVDDFLSPAPQGMRASFQDQLARASLSVSNNIAEGFERGTTNDLLNFIYIARGSAGEVRSMLRLATRRAAWKNHGAKIEAIIERAISCSRQLRGWADSLQNSNIKGQPHLNDKVRSQETQQKNADGFRKQLIRGLPASHPMRLDAEERGLI